MNVVDTTDATFEADVMTASHELPIVVDFWAAWCAPCKMLAPLLEQAVDELGGKVRLVKANTDEAPKAASEFKVQSIPAVFAVVGGEVVDFFQGVLPEPQIKSWLNNLLFHSRVQTATKQIETDASAAEAEFLNILETQPDHTAAQIGLAKALVAQEKTDDARTLISTLESRGYLEPEVEQLKAKLELGESGRTNLDELRKNAATGDIASAIELGKGLAAAGNYEESLEILLNVVRSTSGDDQKSAQQAMLSVFQTLPADSELSHQYRRKLSTALF